MSRCFPYPPPGYTQSRAREEALIESIKLQKEKQRKKEEKEKKKLEKEKKKQRNEEKRREKEEKEREKEWKEGKLSEEEKEKKRERKKERRKEKKDKPNPNLDNSDIVKAFSGQNICCDNDDSIQKKREDGTDLLERSSLTEELEYPVPLPVPSTSTDSTENSNKRKRDSSSIAKGILIRLPSKKQNESDALPKEQQLCTTSGRADCPAQNGHQNLCCMSNGTCKKSGTKCMHNAPVTPMQRVELQCRYLFVNLVPLWDQDRCPSPENLDWLCLNKSQDTRSEKRLKSGNDSMSCSRSTAFWPRAEYLHEIDAYAMPFTVPY